MLGAVAIRKAAEQLLYGLLFLILFFEVKKSMARCFR